jgi:predicted Ser/Thr protein kinase
MNLDHVGKYRVVERIGKGAMGEVYKAHDPLLNRYVALKTIASALASDPEFGRRFKREAQSAASLNHPNIITVFDFGDENGLTYMAMELLEGRDLKELIRSREATLGDKLSIMEQMCEGLAFAHAKGVVHRDLKPSNVHVQPNGQVKILDFGLARLGASEMTRTGTVMGTPHYMSPEQVRGEKADARSDVFSLGAVFYELLTQHRPFDAESVHAVLTQIVDRQPEPIRRWAPDVPQPIVAVVERALAKDAAQRYPEAGELGRALVAARESLAGETVIGGSDRTVSTMLQAPEATVLAPAAGSHPNLRTSIKGATALTLARSRLQAALPTVRPDPTVGPGRLAQLSEGPSATSKVLLAVGVVMVVAAAAGGVVWWRGRSAPPRATEVVKEEVGFLTDALVANKVELARTDLANHDYASAIKRANEVLAIAADNAEARAVLDQAQRDQKQLQDAVSEVRAAVARNDGQGASDALSRVMALDPGHPVIAETSGELNRHFRGQAEQSRVQTEAARAAAEQARAGAFAGFSDGRRLQQEGEAAFGRQQFTQAAQKFSESRNAYERAAREAEAARAAAAALRNVQSQPTAPPTRTASVAPTTAPPVTPTTLAPSAAPSATPHVAPSATLPPPVASPSASPTAAATAVTGSGDVEVRRVIADYVRALSSQDISLYRSIKPDLSADEEKTLKRVFKEISSWQVGINIESVQLDGERATVRASRQDVVNGRPMKAVSQVFRLARSGGSWHIQSMSQ